MTFETKGAHHPTSSNKVSTRKNNDKNQNGQNNNTASSDTINSNKNHTNSPLGMTGAHSSKVTSTNTGGVKFSAGGNITNVNASKETNNIPLKHYRMLYVCQALVGVKVKVQVNEMQNIELSKLYRPRVVS